MVREAQSSGVRPYKGPTGKFRDSIWLSSEDLPHDKDIVVEIEEVQLHDEVTWDQGRKDTNVGALKFKGHDRVLKVNATIKRTLNALFHTTSAGDWWGKKVALFVEQGVERPGGVGPAVRIRARRLEQEPGDE